MRAVADVRVRDRQGRTGRDGRRRPHRPRRPAAPLIVDALGWRRVLGDGDNVQPPDARLSRGLEVHPAAAAETSSSGSTARYVPAGYGWCFPADDELRVGVGSFDPRFHVKEPTVRLAERPRARRRCATRATGSRTSSARRPRTASSSSATPPATACRSPPRASAPRCTSGSPAGASCARWSRAAQRARRGAARATTRSPPRTPGSSTGCCACSGWSRACRRRLLHLGLRAAGTAAVQPLGVRALPRDRAAGVRHRAARQTRGGGAGRGARGLRWTGSSAPRCARASACRCARSSGASILRMSVATAPTRPACSVCSSEVLGPDSSALDVGCHEGAVLAEIVRLAPAGRHVAWEPLPELCATRRRPLPGRRRALRRAVGSRSGSGSSSM